MKKFLTTLFATLAIILIGGVAKVGATAANPQPYFNIYKDVPNVGDESDFVRVSKVGANDFSNNVEACTDGQEVTIRIYIHNGAEPSLNGANFDGPGVTKNEKLAINVAKTTGANDVSATVSADNAFASATDSATVSCNGHVMDLTYKAGSAVIKNTVQNYVGLSDNVFKGGTPIGYAGQDGKQPGCWDYVTYVFAKVVVHKKPIEIPANAFCKLEDNGFVVIDEKNRTVKGGIKADLTNAKVLSYRIDWGDNTPASTKQSDTHSYAKDGKYTIQASITVELNDGTKKTVKTVDGASCATTVEFKPNQPPKVTPPTVTQLVDTGAGSTLGIFAAVSAISALVHRAYTARKVRQEV